MKKKIPYKQKFRTRWLHWGILPNIERTYNDHPEMLPKDLRGRNTLRDIL